MLTHFLATAALLLGFSSVSMAEATNGQIVTVKCVTDQTQEFPFYLLNYNGGGGLVLDGHKVTFSNHTLFGPSESGSKEDLHENDAKYYQAMVEKFNALSCEDKSIDVSKHETRVLIACGPGSEVRFDSRAYAMVRASFGSYGYSRQYYWTQTFAVITNPQFGKYNACDNFKAPIQN